MAPSDEIPTVIPASKVDKEDTVEGAKNEKIEETVEISSDASAKIARQIKHYFCDANLNHDRFMRKAIEMDEGWVPIFKLARFNRLRSLLGVPADRPEHNHPNRRGKPRFGQIPDTYISLLGKIIKNALTDDDNIEINDDGSAIKRKSPFVPSDSWFERTVHFKGLPYGKESPDLIDDLTTHFGDFGKVTLVRLRRNPKTKAFKGNVLVEYSTKDEAEKVAKMEDLKFDENSLEPALLPAYHDEKLSADEYIQPELRKPGAQYPMFEEWCRAHGREPPVLANDKNKRSNERSIVPGALVKFNGVEGDIGFKELKEAFGKINDVGFIDFEKGDAEGIVRFKESVASDVIEKHPDGITVNELTLILSPVEDAEEKEFYERAKKMSENSHKNKRSGHGNFRSNKRQRR